MQGGQPGNIHNAPAFAGAHLVSPTWNLAVDVKAMNRDAWSAMTETMFRTGTPTASPAAAAVFAWRWWADGPDAARLPRW